MTALPEIGSLWIGERLSLLEILCLKSFADMGHPVTLFVYGELENPPDFCSVRDAREIWDDADILRHHERGSPAVHSDIFRIKMIRRTGMIWVDADAYCRKPFEAKDGYLFAPVKDGRFGSGVLSLPQGSPALAAMDDFLSTRGTRPPWWSDEEDRTYREEHGEYDFANMRWGTTGPIALTWFLKETGEERFAAPMRALYPIPVNKKFVIFRRPAKVEPFIHEDSVSIHFYASGVRERIETGDFPASCYFAALCAQHGLAGDGGAATSEETRAGVALVQSKPLPQRRINRLALNLALDYVAAAAAPGLPGLVQVGANDGLRADPVADRVGAGRFRALLLEPSPIYYPELERNRAGVAGVTTLNVGVAPEESSATLYQLNPDRAAEFPDWAQGCASLSREEIFGALARTKPVTDDMIVESTVRLRRLDAILAEHDAFGADVLIVDVEGHEPGVFGSFSLDDFRPGVVLFEKVNLSPDALGAILEQLHGAGYRCWGVGGDALALRADWLPESLGTAIGQLGLREFSVRKPD